MQTRSFAGTAACRLAAVFLIFAAMLLAPGSAQAQQVHHRSLLDIIFGTNPQAGYPPPPPAPSRSTRHAPRRHVSPRAAPAATPPAAAQKIDNARKILVVGDFIAGGLADGLQAAFADSPGVAVIDKTNGSSGLVRDDYYDWPSQIGPILDEVKPAIAVVLVGSNDRQPMRITGHSEPVRSDAWTAEYTRRATAVAEAVTHRRIPLLWVGVPAFQSSSMSADILAFDGIFRAVVSKAGGEFIDTWDGFVDQNGNFVFTGPDINGQPARLRAPDGINLTAAGKRKLAFYVEKPARRLLGSAADKDVAKLTDQNLSPLPTLPPQLPANITRTDPVGFTDPALDGDTILLGGDRQAGAAQDTPRAELVRDGKTAEPPSGRADSFAWDGGDRRTDDPAAKGKDAGNAAASATMEPDPMRPATPGSASPDTGPPSPQHP